MINLQKSILNTLRYHDYFEYALTTKEIWKFLILRRFKLKAKNSKQQLKFKNFRLTLDRLEKEKRIFYKQPYYFLPKRENIVRLRKQREKYSRQKIKIAKKIIKIIKKIPFIKAIAITGALAMNNAKREDDIDIMVITSKNRLWLSRMILLTILQVLGKRRKFGEKEVKDKICLNLFLDEFTLSLLKTKRNLWTAHEIVQAKAILSKNNTWESFLVANMWVKNYLPNSIKNYESGIMNQEYFNKDLFLLNLLNRFAFQLQYKFMKSKITNEDISLHFAFFHPINRASEFKQSLLS